jgi:hypothetical protein
MRIPAKLVFSEQRYTDDAANVPLPSSMLTAFAVRRFIGNGSGNGGRVAADGLFAKAKAELWHIGRNSRRYPPPAPMRVGAEDVAS